MDAFRWRRLLAIGLWLVFGLLVHMVAPTLNGVKLAGVPLGYGLATTGAPVLLLGLALWLAPRRSRRENR